MTSLLTSPLVMGLLAWVGLIATIVGLWIAIDQILRTKKAAKAAEAAVLKLEGAVFSRERLLELATAAAHVANAKEHIAQRNLQVAVTLIDVALPLCTQVRALLSAPEQPRLQKVILRLKKLNETLSGAPPGQVETIIVSAAREARAIVLEMNEIHSILRYQYPKEGSL